MNAMNANQTEPDIVGTQIEILFGLDQLRLPHLRGNRISRGKTRIHHHQNAATRLNPCFSIMKQKNFCKRSFFLSIVAGLQEIIGASLARQHRPYSSELNRRISALKKRWLPFTFLMKSLLTTATTLSVVVGARAGESDNRTGTNFINPIITEEVLPDEPGDFTLRLGTDYRQRNSEVNAVLPYAEACFGLIDRFGATVNVPMAYHNEGTGASYGIGDVSAILKYLAVRPSPSVPAVVFGLESQFPTGNEHLGLGAGAYELTPYVALLKEFGPLLVQGNFGWSTQVTDNREAAWVYNWAAVIPLYQRKFYLLTEINGDWGRPNRSAIAPGIKYLFSDKFSVGVAAPIGLNRNTEAWGIVTQFQFDF
jgi:hypothetical protein